jgi:hypothetical protein
LAKYLGEGTSREKAEEKSSAFSIFGAFGFGRMIAPQPGNPLTQNVISDAGK